MKEKNCFLSTIAPDASLLARKYGLGLEIAEFCTAYRMDAEFAETDRILKENLAGVSERILHGPFNELFPCAIDPRARNLAAQRYDQAAALAEQYAAGKVVFHAGFAPSLYYPCWFVEKSVEFWREFLKIQPQGRVFCLENVMETDPQWLREIVSGVDDPRLGICLDVGHANTYSTIPVLEWLGCLSPWLKHFHIHNNHGDRDSHSGLTDGTIPMAEFLRDASVSCPNATFTLELPENPEKDIIWMIQNHLLEE